MTMTITKPVTLTDAMLTSSTVPETDHAAWAAATSYTAGQKVIRTTTHRIYECLPAGVGVSAILPENSTTGVSPRWLDIGPTNRWAMFDQKVGTVTQLAAPLTVVLRPGSVSGLALLELTGAQLVVSVKDAPGGAEVYSKTISLDGSVIDGFFDWFFADYVQLSDINLTDLPSQYSACELTIALTGSSVGCGVCHFGRVYALGETLAGATVGIVSYSTKTADAFGNIAVVKRPNSKRNSLKLLTKKADFNTVYRLLASLDSIPCIFSAVGTPGYEPLIVYGFWKDFSIDVAYPSHQLTNIEIEGLI